MPLPMLSTAPRTQILLAMGMITLSMAFFSVMNIFIREAATQLHTTQLVFLRNLFSLFLFVPWLLKTGLRPALATQHWRNHLWRGLVGTVGMQLWFYSVTTLPLNEATALSFTAPVFTTIIAIMFLGERAGWRRWSAILISFAGALIVIAPDPDNMNWDMLIVPAATTMWAIAAVLVKSLTETEPANRIVFYMALTMSIASLPPALYYWQTPDAVTLLWVAGVAVASTAAHLFTVRAFARAPMVVLMPFEFTRLIFTALLSAWLYNEFAAPNLWAGGAIIVGSTAYIAYRESRKSPQEAE